MWKYINVDGKYLIDDSTNYNILTFDASDGVISWDGQYIIYTYTTPGPHIFVTQFDSLDVSILLVGGGSGSEPPGNSGASGGGGGGEVKDILNLQLMEAGRYLINVGNGGFAEWTDWQSPYTSYPLIQAGDSMIINIDTSTSLAHAHGAPQVLPTDINPFSFSPPNQLYGVGGKPSAYNYETFHQHKGQPSQPWADPYVHTMRGGGGGGYGLDDASVVSQVQVGGVLYGKGGNGGTGMQSQITGLYYSGGGGGAGSNYADSNSWNGFHGTGTIGGGGNGSRNYGWAPFYPSGNAGNSGCVVIKFRWQYHIDE